MRPLPFQRHETIPGTAGWLSPDAEEKVSSQADPSATNSTPFGLASIPSRTGLMYRLKIKPDRNCVLTGNHRHMLTAGLIAQADS
jgi:hypothetical protein